MIALLLRLVLCVLLALGLAACGQKNPAASATAGAEAVLPPNALELVFTYGSEKQKWVEELTVGFNAARHQTSGGKTVVVKAVPLGSGDVVSEVLSGKRPAHLISPASAAFIRLGNAESQAKTGQNLVGETVNLVLSPVVIAMWKPMAEALGWPQKRLGWKDIHDLALAPGGWKARGQPQWGDFRFGHTHPEYSNSGLISLFAEAYAGAGKTRGLELADLQNPATSQYIADIERAVVHYGESTGFFGRKLFEGGPQYLSAAVLYENMVIESTAQAGLAFPLVALYPAEGTFWSDHPAGIVERDYVTPEHREAARKYLDFLTARPQQEKAMAHGFRPADPAIPLAAPFDAAHGVDPKEPQTTLEVPEAAVMKAALDLWKLRKKKSHIVLVLDVSGSMNAPPEKMANARLGARKLLALLSDQDHFSLLPFNQDPGWMLQNQPLAQSRPQAERMIDTLIANGGTALYDAVREAHQFVAAHPQSDKITALVVLSDGADTNSKNTTLEALLGNLSNLGPEGGSGYRVFTIGYGDDAKADVLEKISAATRAKFFKGTPANIESVFRDISTFF